MTIKLRSYSEILSSLRSVAAIKNNLTIRERHGTLRRGDKTRLRKISRALKLLQADLKTAKEAESGSVAR